MNITQHSDFTHTQIRLHLTNSNTDQKQLDLQQKRQLQQLQTRDRAVRAHEAAHIAVGGKLIKSRANFQYKQGPDGKQYAVGGEVRIDTNEISGDPEATLNKAEQIRSAALAPAQPSTQDRAVAAKAMQMAVRARAEIRQQNDTNDTSAHNNPFLTVSTDTQPQLDITV